MSFEQKKAILSAYSNPVSRHLLLSDAWQVGRSIHSSLRRWVRTVVGGGEISRVPLRDRRDVTGLDK